MKKSIVFFILTIGWLIEGCYEDKGCLLYTSMQLPEMENMVLVFSFTGMKKQEVKYTKQPVLNGPPALPPLKEGNPLTFPAVVVS